MMSETYSLGVMAAFPVPHDSSWCAGMTYRQWLIGQIAANVEMFVIVSPIEAEAAAQNFILLADAIIAQLDKEPKQP